MTTEPAQAENRVALVIGNSDYSEVENHPKAAIDANLVAKTLSELGFTVTLRTDLGQANMLEQLRTFVRTARLADIAFLYYAGHGVSIDERSYIIPTDAQPNGIESAGVELIEVGALLRQLEFSGGKNLVVLEAGARNGFTQALINLRSRVREVRLSSTLNAFQEAASVHLVVATQPAQDFEYGNSPVSKFTSALVENMKVRGQTFSEVVTQTIASVSASTSGKQTPWSANGLNSRIRLNGSPLVAPPQLGEQDGSKDAWQALQSSNIVAEFKAFVASYPDSPLKATALQRLVWLENLDPKAQQELENKTRDFRALKRLLSEAVERDTARERDLARTGYPLVPQFTRMLAEGDVTIRSLPTGAGEWLGLLREGESREVVGALFNRRWVMVQLSPTEISRLYSATGRQIPQNPQTFGFISSKNLVKSPGSDESVWQEQVTKTDVRSVEAFINDFPGSRRRAEAIRLLLELRHPRLLNAEANSFDTIVESVVGVRPNLDISQDLEVETFKGEEQATVNADPVAVDSLSIGPSQGSQPQGPRIVRIPEMGFDMELVETEFVTKTRSNLRRLPWVKTKRLATVNADQRLVVTGKVVDVDWYRVKWGDGRDLYVFGELVEPYSGSSLEAWENVQKSREIADAEDYLERFPTGRHAERVLDLLRVSGAIATGQSRLDLVHPTASSAVSRLRSSVAANELINVYPIIYENTEQDALTNRAISALGNHTGARVISDVESLELDAKVAVFEVLGISINPLSSGATEAGENIEGNQADGPEVFEMKAAVRVSLIQPGTAEFLSEDAVTSVLVNTSETSIAERLNLIQTAIIAASAKLPTGGEG